MSIRNLKFHQRMVLVVVTLLLAQIVTYVMHNGEHVSDPGAIAAHSEGLLVYDDRMMLKNYDNTGELIWAQVLSFLGMSNAVGLVVEGDIVFLYLERGPSFVKIDLKSGSLISRQRGTKKFRKSPLVSEDYYVSASGDIFKQNGDKKEMFIVAKTFLTRLNIYLLFGGIIGMVMMFERSKGNPPISHRA